MIYQRATDASATRTLIYNGSEDSSTTSFLVEGLLAETLYFFSVVPVNQYGIFGVPDDNVEIITTSAAEAPSSPTSLAQSQVDGAFFDLSFQSLPKLAVFRSRLCSTLHVSNRWHRVSMTHQTALHALT